MSHSSVAFKTLQRNVSTDFRHCGRSSRNEQNSRGSHMFAFVVKDLLAWRLRAAHSLAA